MEVLKIEAKRKGEAQRMEGRLTQWKSVCVGTRESPKRAGRLKAWEGNKMWEAHTAEACTDLGEAKIVGGPPDNWEDQRCKVLRG